MPPMMTCPHCQSREISKRNGTTDLGYELLRCDTCCRKFNKRTGTPFNHLEFPTDIVFQVVLCRLRYKLSLSSQRFCSAFDDVRQYFRPRLKRKQFVSLARQRQQFLARVHVLQSSFLAT